MGARLHNLFLPDSNLEKDVDLSDTLQDAGIIKIVVTIELFGKKPKLVVDGKYKLIGTRDIIRYIEMYKMCGEATPRILPDSYGNRL